MSKSVLVIDDESDLLDTIEEALHFGGYKVIRAGNGMQAWELLSVITPNIILCDYMMPKMNGGELFDLIRSSDNGRDIPFIFMSSTPEVINSVGTYGVLRKPFQFDRLMAKLNFYVDPYSALDQEL